MIARRLAVILGFLVLAFSGTYVFVYLYRWEWNRALFCLGLFVAVEIALGLAHVVNKLNKLSERVGTLGSVDPAVLARISETAPEPSRPFAWLSPEEQAGKTAVFVPVLMGAGLVLSGVAWAVERLASSTARPVMEQGLARRLSVFALPDELVPSTRPRSSLFHP
jgi:hypothetical protein